MLRADPGQLLKTPLRDANHATDGRIASLHISPVVSVGIDLAALRGFHQQSSGAPGYQRGITAWSDGALEEMGELQGGEIEMANSMQK